ncbi:MAG: LysR family transcriptional regulator [Desulfovibrio sp.]
MELRQLRYFQAVAEELHFGRAADRVHIAQPPLSQQIKRLEEELGVELLRRSSRKVELTPEGARFLESAREILERVEGAVHAVRAMARGEAGRLRVGFVGPASDSLFPEAVRDYRAENPGVQLVLLEMGTTDQLEALRRGEIDLGVIRLFHQNLRGFQHEPFAREPYVLALPESHPLTALDEIPLASLEGVPLILFPRRFQPALYDTIMARLRQAGVTPYVVQRAITKQTKSALVASGLGAAFLHASSRKAPRAGVAYRPLAGEFPLMELEMVWRPESATEVLRRFVDTLRRRSLPGGA